jgi:hypothetical protein
VTALDPVTGRVSVGAVDGTINATYAGLTLSALTGDTINTDALFAIYETAGSFGDRISAPIAPSLLSTIAFIAGWHSLGHRRPGRVPHDGTERSESHYRRWGERPDHRALGGSSDRRFHCRTLGA